MIGPITYKEVECTCEHPGAAMSLHLDTCESEIVRTLTEEGFWVVRRPESNGVRLEWAVGMGKCGTSDPNAFQSSSPSLLHAARRARLHRELRAEREDDSPEPAKAELRPDYYRVRLKGRIHDPDPALSPVTTTVEVECLDLIDALGLGFYLGNVLKYLFRVRRKHVDPAKDLLKIRTYAEQAHVRYRKPEEDR